MCSIVLDKNICMLMYICMPVCAGMCVIRIHIYVYICMYMYTCIHTLGIKIKTILNRFPRPPTPNTRSVTDLYLNSSVNSSGSSPSHCFSSIPNLQFLKKLDTFVIKLYKVADKIQGKQK